MNRKEWAFFLLRVGVGIIFILHGHAKLAAGPERWEAVGRAMAIFGINFAPVFWGLLATLSEFLGGILLILGLLVTPAAFFMMFTMVVASTMHLSKGEGFSVASHPILAAVVFLGIMVHGKDRFGIISLINSLKGKA